MAGKTRKPVPPAAVPGARALLDDDGGTAANALPRPAVPGTAAAATPPARRKRRARFVF